MKTKEVENFIGDITELSTTKEIDAVYEKVEQYAQQEAIAFTKWLESSQWEKESFRIGVYSLYTTEIGYEYKTTAELYDIFKHQNKQP